MVRHIRAIFENGVFRPIEGLNGLRDHAAVRLRVEEEESPTWGGTLADFAGRWNAADADQIAAVIKAEFERIDEREW